MNQSTGVQSTGDDFNSTGGSGPQF
jgi:hypothetical protein